MLPPALINTQLSAAVGQESQADRPVLSIFPEWLFATSAVAAGQSMRLPQIVNRSISSRSLLLVLCFGSEAPCASSSSSPRESEEDGSSGSGVGVGGRLVGTAGDVSADGGGSRSVLGVGWVVTEEDGDLQGVAGMCSTLDSPERNSEQRLNVLTGVKTYR